MNPIYFELGNQSQDDSGINSSMNIGFLKLPFLKSNFSGSSDWSSDSEGTMKIDTISDRSQSQKDHVVSKKDLNEPKEEKQEECKDTLKSNARALKPNPEPRCFNSNVDPLEGSLHASIDKIMRQFDSSPLWAKGFHLQKEINHVGGVLLDVFAADVINNLALVTIKSRVWVAGWRNTCPELKLLFHIGDQIMQINRVPVTSASETRDLAKAVISLTKPMGSSFSKSHIESSIEKCQVLIRRLPLAKVVVVHPQKLLARRPPKAYLPLGLETYNGSNQVSIIYEVVQCIRCNSQLVN
ncbi:hypothetical protein Ciccas_006077 [Cichlidogyrus casuarinus]|uniref:PDZ domain-containing protein n=1 Tax=Cichlidogyrus casuarinus TaxID=1844966 RepID=A0ABD2Q755_9PLAT